MPNRKLGKASDHRNAMLRNLTTALLWNGKIVTTEAKAKEIRKIAEGIIALGVKADHPCRKRIQEHRYRREGNPQREAADSQG